MIIGGMDVSGNTQIGNYKYLGIVIGTSENINSIIKHLEYEQVLQNTYKYNRKTLVSKLKFNNNESIAFCIRIDKKTIIDKLKNNLRKKHYSISIGKLFHAYNYLILHRIRDQITEFTHKHNTSLSEINFQCDYDCKNFAKDNGLRYTKEGNAHMLSDLVAWSNNKGFEPDGVVAMDITQYLEKELRTFFK